ncbi:MAG: myxococcus cysteine-rich repeat containing protein [Myxococcales bacterium]
MGQIVPLLYGRVVRVEDLDTGIPAPTLIPLDDPSDVGHREFFGSLESACVRETQAQLAPPGPGVGIPGCGRDGVFQAYLALCRARASDMFLAPGFEGGLVEANGGSSIQSESVDPSRALWRIASTTTNHRASWAMYAVEQRRDALAALAYALDPNTCPQGLNEQAGPTPTPLGALAAQTLLDAASALSASTSTADELLRMALVEREQRAENADAARVALTRGLNDSLLERMRLYVGVPYGAFAPIANQALDASRSGLYPALLAPSDQRVEDVATMLAALGTDILDDHGRVRPGDDLVTSWYASLREAEPLAFGTLGGDEAPLALSRLGIGTADLARGAEFVASEQRVSGTPIMRTPLAVPDWRKLETITYLDEPGLDAYAYLLTEARASMDERDPRDYARRGLFHGLEYAQRVKERAVQRADLDASALSTLGSELSTGERVVGHARVCWSRDDDEIKAVIEVAASSTASLGTQAFQLFSGEQDAVCGTRGALFGAPCEQPEGLVAKLDAGRLIFEASAPSPAPSLYLVSRADAQIVAAFSLNPFEDVEQERCATVPLATQSLRELARIHADSIGDGLPRKVSQPAGSLPYRLDTDTPVPLLWERTISFTDQAGTAHVVDLAQPFDSWRQSVEAAVQTPCSLPPLQDADSPISSCRAQVLRSVEGLRCLVAGLDQPQRLASSLSADTAASLQRSLQLWKADTQRKLLVEAAKALTDDSCDAPADPSVADAEKLIDARLWELVLTTSRDAYSHYELLRDQLADDRTARWDDESDSLQVAVGSSRALHDSRLAAARLLMAVPYGLYEPTDGETHDDLANALVRFPVVSHPAETAEDTRIESFLRKARLHPLLPDLTVKDEQFNVGIYDDAVSSGVLATRLRSRLIALEPDRYAAAPAGASEFLSWLGVSTQDLSHASARLVQLSELRGPSLLPAPATQPVQASGLVAGSPAPHAARLYALTEGRAHMAADAWPTSFATRGLFHAFAFVEGALRTQLAAADALESSTRDRYEAIWAELASLASAPSFFVRHEAHGGLSEISWVADLPVSSDSNEALQPFELWWTDSGLTCALGGLVDNTPCEGKEFRLGSDASEVTWSSATLPRSRRVQVDHLVFPTPTTWDPNLTDERKRGRVYLIERTPEGPQVRAATSLAAGQTSVSEHGWPRSRVWEDQLVDLLAYRPAGAGCSACAPASVCETTACELGVCLRTPRAGSCAAEGQCVDGVCDKPGCGDGALMDGEACDDGNLADGDGCSSTCSVETRRLEPSIEEGWPAGPAPAVSVDGLGRALVVYSADDLTGNDEAVRGARFDAFGTMAGSEFVIEAGLPRGFQGQPTVAGLAAGGFVVVYGTPAAGGGTGLVYRHVDGSGVSGPARAVWSINAVQTGGRVVAVDDGFAVTWAERRADSAESRVRLRFFDQQGEPFGPAMDVGTQNTGTTELQPALASSNGQVLVAWTEADTEQSERVAVRGRRFSSFGTAIEAPFEIATGDAGEPSASVLGNGDYVVAWTTRTNDPGGDIWARTIQRFGDALALDDAHPVAATEAAERLPVIAADAESGFLLAYQLGTPFSLGAIYAPTLDPDSVELTASELARSDRMDVSAVSSSQGIWVVWSERLAQQRALYAIVLPYRPSLK